MYVRYIYTCTRELHHTLFWCLVFVYLFVLFVCVVDVAAGAEGLVIWMVECIRSVQRDSVLSCACSFDVLSAFPLFAFSLLACSLPVLEMLRITRR